MEPSPIRDNGPYDDRTAATRQFDASTFGIPFQQSTLNLMVLREALLITGVRPSDAEDRQLNLFHVYDVDCVTIQVIAGWIVRAHITSARESLLVRLARTLDIPPEIMAGQQGFHHWSEIHDFYYSSILPSGTASTSEQSTIIKAALTSTGVDLSEFEEHHLDRIGNELSVAMSQVIAAWIVRAHISGMRQERKRMPPAQDHDNSQVETIRCVTLVYIDSNGVTRTVEIPDGNDIVMTYEDIAPDHDGIMNTPQRAMSGRSIKVTIEARHGIRPDGVLARFHRCDDSER